MEASGGYLTHFGIGRSAIDHASMGLASIARCTTIILWNAVGGTHAHQWSDAQCQVLRCSMPIAQMPNAVCTDAYPMNHMGLIIYKPIELVSAYFYSEAVG